MIVAIKFKVPEFHLSKYLNLVGVRKLQLTLRFTLLDVLPIQRSDLIYNRERFESRGLSLGKSDRGCFGLGLGRLSLEFGGLSLGLGGLLKGIFEFYFVTLELSVVIFRLFGGFRVDQGADGIVRYGVIDWQSD